MTNKSKVKFMFVPQIKSEYLGQIRKSVNENEIDLLRYQSTPDKPLKLTKIRSTKDSFFSKKRSLSNLDSISQIPKDLHELSKKWSKFETSNKTINKLQDEHDKYILRKKRLKKAINLFKMQQENDPNLEVKEELYIDILIKEQEKSDQSNYKLFASPEVLKTFLEHKNRVW